MAYWPPITYILTQPPESFTVTLTHDDGAHEDFDRSDISKGDLSLNPSAVLFPTLYQMRSTERFMIAKRKKKREGRKEGKKLEHTFPVVWYRPN
jgi:hypothetical protein